MTDNSKSIAVRGEYSITGPARTEPSDPFSELRDQLAILEEEATELLRGCKENALVELSPIRRVFSYVGRMRRGAWVLEKELAEAKNKNELLGARLRQLEGIVQSAFTRAVKGLSTNAPAAQAGADKVLRLVEEHTLASRFLDSNEVPGSTLLQRVQWLHDKATQTIAVGGYTVDETNAYDARGGAVIEVDAETLDALAKR